jgi:hypothetical protein
MAAINAEDIGSVKSILLEFVEWEIRQETIEKMEFEVCGDPSETCEPKKGTIEKT